MMIRSMSALLSLTILGLLLSRPGFGWPDPPLKENGRIRELQKERLAVLETLSESAQALFKHARLSDDELHATQIRLFTARYDYAETPQERLKAAEELLQEGERWQEIMQARFESARSSRIPVLEAQAALLDAKILREKAMAGQ